MTGRLSVEGGAPAPSSFTLPLMAAAGRHSVVRGRNHVANDPAANRWNLSSAAASGRVPRGRASGVSLQDIRSNRSYTAESICCAIH